MRADLDALAAEDALLARVQAQLIRRRALLAEHALTQSERMASWESRERDMPLRSLAAEVACATRQNDRTVQRELSDAFSLVSALPATVDAREAGRVSMRHVDVIHEIGVRLEEADVRAAWERVVLDYAATTSPARTRASAAQLAESVHAVPMQERFDAAHASREVSVIDLADGMALLQVLLPATIAHGIIDRIRRQSRAIQRAATAERARHAAAPDDGAAPAPASAAGTGAPSDGARSEDAGCDDHSASSPAGSPIDDTRTLPQIQADLVADMLLTAAPAIEPAEVSAAGGLGSIRAHVQIVVPVTTLTGTTRGGALLNGQVPVDPVTARRLAGGPSGWDRVMRDPLTGTVLATDRSTPRRDQVRYLQARDQHCRAFGCRQSVARCQIDHDHERRHGAPPTSATSRTSASVITP
jgi:hypothetical protein